MDPIHWFIYLYSCIGMYRNGENQKFVYLSWDIFTTDLLPKPILQNNFIKKSAKKQHMEKLKVVLSPYWHDVTTVKKSLESKNSAHSDVNSMWNESHRSPCIGTRNSMSKGVLALTHETLVKICLCPRKFDSMCGKTFLHGREFPKSHSRLTFSLHFYYTIQF